MEALQENKKKFFFVMKIEKMSSYMLKTLRRNASHLNTLSICKIINLYLTLCELYDLVLHIISSKPNSVAKYRVSLIPFML